MKRLPSLDGLRGLAILFVLVWHYFVTLIPAAPGSAIDLVKHLFAFAWTGVDLFFVLSGFLIGGILIDDRGTPYYFRTFYLRRACRIVPLYFVLLAGFVLCRSVLPFQGELRQWLFGDPMPLWTYATFTQNLAMAHASSFGPNWLGVTWSLAIEEQFYLVFPLIVFFAAPRRLPTFLVLGILMAPALRTALPGYRTFVETPYRADSLLIGAFLAWMVRRTEYAAAAKRSHAAAALGTSLCAAGALVWLYRHFSITPMQFFGRAAPISLTAAALLYGAFLLLALDDSRQPGRALTWAPLIWFGRRSYGIYLLHQAILGIGLGFGVYGNAAISRTQPYLASRLTILGSLAATLILAEISHRFFESPIIAWGRRFTDAPR